MTTQNFLDHYAVEMNENDRVFSIDQYLPIDQRSCTFLGIPCPYIASSMSYDLRRPKFDRKNIEIFLIIMNAEFRVITHAEMTCFCPPAKSGQALFRCSNKPSGK